MKSHILFTHFFCIYLLAIKSMALYLFKFREYNNKLGLLLSIVENLGVGKQETFNTKRQCPECYNSYVNKILPEM